MPRPAYVSSKSPPPSSRRQSLRLHLTHDRPWGPVSLGHNDAGPLHLALSDFAKAESKPATLPARVSPVGPGSRCVTSVYSGCTLPTTIARTLPCPGTPLGERQVPLFKHAAVPAFTGRYAARTEGFPLRLSLSHLAPAARRCRRFCSFWTV